MGPDSLTGRAAMRVGGADCASECAQQDGSGAVQEPQSEAPPVMGVLAGGTAR